MLNRRDFLATGVGSLLLPPAATWADADRVPVSGIDRPQLAPFDALMTRFVQENKLPGAAVAITRQGKLMYARGFGYADIEQKKVVEPKSFFRLASISKPITAVAVLHLADQAKLKLDDPVLKHTQLQPFLHPNIGLDPRWKLITIRQCLRHTAGWDRDREGGFDPIGIPWKIKKGMRLNGSPSPSDIVRYMMGLPLDFDPGSRMCYSNLGYLVLGRVIEEVTGENYERWTNKHILGPVRATSFSLGKALPEKRPAQEVRYYEPHGRKGACLYPPRMGQQVLLPDGAENLESFEAHGGWICSAIDLVRFASAFDYGKKSPLLSAAAITQMWERPLGLAGFSPTNAPKPSYYGCGWEVRPIPRTGKANAWHGGLISGTSTLLVRRFDGLNWAVLFNTDANHKDEKPADLIDSPMHAAADAVRNWPSDDLFEQYQG